MKKSIFTKRLFFDAKHIYICKNEKNAYFTGVHFCVARGGLEPSINAQKRLIL